MAAAIQGRLMDIFYRREETRVGGDFRQYPERFRVERARFIVAIPFITCVLCPSHFWRRL